MRINKIGNLSYGMLFQKKLDVLVAASGYESRATAVAKELLNHRYAGQAVKKAWAFHEYSDEKVRIANDRFYKDNGYDYEKISGDEYYRIKEWITDYLNKTMLKEITLLIDISSMTRNWYGSLIKAISLHDRLKKVRTIFSYTPEKWSNRPSNHISNNILGPVPGYASYMLPIKPTALVIGLGSEPERALGLKDHLDPEQTKCFYSCPGASEKYVTKILKANAELLEELKPEDRFTYNLFNPHETFKKVESYCSGIARDYNLVMASLGPKLFCVYCFLISTQMPDISVWRVSPTTRKRPIDIKDSGHRILFDVEWIGNSTILV